MTWCGGCCMSEERKGKRGAVCPHRSDFGGRGLLFTDGAEI
jgi:hypothetical protein